MSQLARINEIYDILRSKHNASTKYLCSALGISESTVRRALDFLAATDDRIRRVRGGVVLENTRDDFEYMFELKTSLNVELKRRIAQAVGDHVSDGESLILDSGTTCLHAAMQFHDRKDLRVITTDVKIAEELAKYENLESIVVGGVIRPGFYSIGQSPALEMLDHFAVDKVIMSADAVDIVKGITNLSTFEVEVKKKIIDIARTAILIADHTKFGKVSLYRVADLSRYATIITTKELDAQIAEEIRDLGIRLVLA